MNCQRLWSLLFLLVVPCSLLHAKETKQETNYIAKAGNRYISEREFLSRFEMLPGLTRHRKSQVETAKGELLYSMIAEKLLTQEAEARGLDRDSVLQQGLQTIRKKLSRDELYRVEVSGKVTLTDVEIVRGIARATTLPMTSYYFFKNEADARFVRAQMKTPADFETLAVDSSYHAFRDTATVIWGDAEAELEDAVYGVKAGSISPVIRAGDGYYIIKVVKVIKNTDFASMPPDALRDKVIGVLRLRKERVRMNEYLEQVLADKQGYSVPSSFIRLAKTLRDVYCRSGKTYPGLFDRDVMAEVVKRLKPHLGDSLSVVGSAMWTMGDVLGKLTSKRLKVETIDSNDIPGILNTQIKVLVQQELLEQEALRRGLDQSPGVKEKIEIWRDAMLSGQMKATIQRSISATDADIFTAMKDLGMKDFTPQVNVRLLVTNSLEDMNAALGAIRGGMSFAEAATRWSVDAATREKGGETGYFPITERVPVGEKAWSMTVGDVYGPLSNDRQHIMFELIGKKNLRTASDTSFAAKFEQAKARLLSVKYKDTLKRFLAQAGGDRGFTIFEDRLKKIEVTTIPMMTFRILGFGGRLFEVPFVEPQLDWLDVDPPKTKVIP